MIAGRPIRKGAAVLSIGLALLFGANAFAQTSTEDIPDRGHRWFEVEVLVFRYTEPTAVDSEQFALTVSPISVEGSRDLFTHRLTPDISPIYYALPQCEDTRAYVRPIREKILSVETLRSEIELPPEQLLGCRRLPEIPLVPHFYSDIDEKQPVLPRQLPVIISGNKRGTREEMLIAETPFLVVEDQFELTPLRQQIHRRRDAEPILHTAWRQPVFSRTVGRKHRLIGGRNFTDDFEYFGFPTTSRSAEIVASLQDSLQYHEQAVDTSTGASTAVANVQHLLSAIERNEFTFAADSTLEAQVPQRPQQVPRGLPEHVWEFDGLLHIYLVGNYLHIDTDFNLREVIQLDPAALSVAEQVSDFLEPNAHNLEFLRAYPFKQLRRVISHQTHYFDHPNYGIVVQIRRTELSNRR
ncbi:CsiV family protein [Aliidiomarina indica]|uniref:CsiV family protein n=1 Tax=Aliidiomarina indica TaxID=2749147 RepID=UPI00188DE647|nr:CsiV family protein [Aliidiomarina indica]